jgi:hypothetical protein
MTKQHILDEISRTAAANSGKPLGWRAFERLTGIRYADWFGKYWKGWGEALVEAGFRPNAMQARFPEDYVLRRFAELVRELGRVPVKGDLRLKRLQDPSLPNDKVFQRLGSKRELLQKVAAFCAGNAQYADVVALLPAQDTDGVVSPGQTGRTSPTDGFVYLLRSGRHYKLGKTNAFGRRERELAIQLPVKPSTVHTIRTDDPDGIEAYWHRRFASKRAHGEWFTLTPHDVAAFKRRRFQ